MLAKFFLAFLGCTQVSALSVVSTSGSKVALKVDGVENEQTFKKVYFDFMKDFDEVTHEKTLNRIAKAISLLKTSDKNVVAFSGYKTVPDQEICEASTSVAIPTEIQTQNGEAYGTYGMDITKLVLSLLESANGPAQASSGLVGMMAVQGLALGAGMIQSVASSQLEIIPPMITGQPLPCMPLATGSVCVGSTPYTITASDALMGDVTDKLAASYIASFPSLYASKVGKTTDELYKTCFASYMSMQCSSLFPKCSTPNGFEALRLPMCFTTCLSTLVACPGFWIDDLPSGCRNSAAPPACATAYFTKVFMAPPQIASYEDSHPTPISCPNSGQAGQQGSASQGQQIDQGNGASGSIKLPRA